MRKMLNTLFVLTPESYLSLEGETVVVNQNGTEGQYSSAKVHRLLKVEKRIEIPRSVEDYAITCGELEGLKCEVYDEF